MLPSKLCNLSKENEYGITLISLNEEFRKKTEPGAASYKDRIAALKILHKKGCKTWVSIEPYPTPNIIEQDLSRILETISFVDKIIFGRLNYNKKVTQFKDKHIFYKNSASTVIEFCKKNKMAFHIKKGTI